MQVQAKVEVEMGTLQRSGGESARQLTKELREVQDRAIAAEMAAQARQRQVAAHVETVVRLETQIAELKDHLKSERRERVAANTSLTRQQSATVVDMETREAQHGSAIQQLVTTHAASVEVLKRQRNEEMKHSASQLAETRASFEIDPTLPPRIHVWLLYCLERRVL
jgi:hypothetical protein